MIFIWADSLDWLSIYTYSYTTMNQINDILLEWAMRSPDGLASGAWTDANLTALRESLESRGMSESECNEIMSEIIEFNEADKSPEQIANKNKRLIKKAALSPNATPEQKLEWEKIKKDTEKSKREKWHYKGLTIVDGYDKLKVYFY